MGFVLNDQALEPLARELEARFGATLAEARKVFAALHAPRKPLAAGAELAAIADTRAVRRTVLNGLLADGTLGRLQSLGHQTSELDGFRRYLFETHDGQRIEAVRIPIPCVTGEPIPEHLNEKPHYVVCVSSQVGCALACAFCATGKLGFRRNLQVHEIVEQVRIVRAEADRPVRGVVFMGMGEPMLNYDRVIAAAQIFSAPAGYAIAADRITVSTAGVVPGIRRFTAERQPYRLAVSLTAATSEKRRQVMPIEDTWPLPDLMAAVRAHQAASGQRAMLAWVAIDGFNTGADDVAALQTLTSGLPLRLDLIDVADPTQQFQAPNAETLSGFRSGLQILGQPVVRRYSGGRDVDAGCGMLAAKAVPSEVTSTP
jgi:23S rRNA (adenine2503-C2)-methyltransferase